MVDGLLALGGHQDLCNVKGKQHWDAFPSQASQRATKVLELVQMDLCGAMQTVSLGGSLYFMLLVDDFSRLCWVSFLHQKSKAFPSFSPWLVGIKSSSQNYSC